MRHPLDELSTSSNMHRLLAYVADLELEVDRLRKRGHHIHQEVRSALKKIQLFTTEEPAVEKAPQSLRDISQVVHQLQAALRDLQDSPGYHPAHDQVITIAVRPLVEQVFRWQQRIMGVPEIALRLDLESELVEWFPARLRHILDNLLSNCLKYQDPKKVEAWVHLALRVTQDGYEFRVSDNGLGLPESGQQQVFELFYRAAPARAAGLGVGLAVVKLLVEQSGGKLTVDAGEGQGTCFVVTLPRFDVDDYLL